MSEIIRTFWAIDLPEAHKELISEQLEGLKAEYSDEEICWMRPEKYHITLRFLGDTALEDVPKIAADVAAEVSSFGVFELGFVPKIEFFPNDEDKAYLTLMPEPTEPLVALVAKIVPLMSEYGFAPDERMFKPHVTLARLKKPIDITPPEVNGVASVKVDQIALLQSGLSNGNYKHLAEVNL